MSCPLNHTLKKANTPISEVGELENSNRSIPKDGLSSPDNFRKKLNCLRSLIEDLPTIRNVLVLANDCWSFWVVFLSTNSIDRQMNFNPFFFGFIHDFLKSTWVFWHINTSAAQLMPFELLQERIAHSTSNNDFISHVEHIENQLDFISNFRPSKND